MKRTLVRAAVAASFAATVLGATGVASAAPMHEDNASRPGHATVVKPRSLDQCAGGRICVWQNTDFTGNWTSLIAQFPGQCQPIYGGGRSVYNNSAYTEKVYSGANCTGAAYIVYAGVAGVSDWTINSVGGYP